MTSASDEKWRPFNCIFSVKGTGGSSTGPDPENRVGDQDMGRPGRPVSSGLQNHVLKLKKCVCWSFLLNLMQVCAA